MKRLILSSLFFLSFFSYSLKAQMGHVPGDLMVQLEKGAGMETLVKRLGQYNGAATGIEVVKLLSPPLDIWLLHFDPSAVEEDGFLEYVWRQPEVKLAQFNHYISERNIIPDDPQFNSQWQWVNAGGGGAVEDADVDADAAWEITTGGLTATGKEIVVAVVESGININHPDLAANIWHNLAEIPDNGIDDDNNGYLDDYDGWNVNQDNDNIPSANHGTAVSGMIGATGNNTLGVTGINWNVKVMAISMQGVFESNVVEAYTYPYVLRKRFNETNGEEGAMVVAINSSWGIDGGQPSNAPIWCAFYDTLGVEGILSCGATANNNVNIDEVGDLPTACPSDYMVAVTATNSSDVRTFSGYGTHSIDLGAPGASIFTLSTSGYGSTSGTSFASPLTAGVIALMYSIPCETLGQLAVIDPAGTALLVRDALFEGVDVIPNLIPETMTGGRVNALRSLEILLENCGPCPKAGNFAASEVTDTSVVLSWSAAPDAQDYHIRYRLEGDLEWDTIFNAANPYLMAGLSGCQTYEAQVFTICTDTTSEFSGSYFFDTEGCCVAPDEIAASDITEESATLSWNTVYAASGYLLSVQSLDSTSLNLTVDPMGSEFFLEGLAPCTGYRVSLVTDCEQGTSSSPSEEVVFYTLCPCPSPDNADTITVNMTDATYSWEGAENATTYLVRYKELTAVNWTFAEVTGTSIFLDSLEACRNYRIQVKTVCPIAESDYSSAVVFKTDCTPSQTEEQGAVKQGLLVTPNPFSEEMRVVVTLESASDIEIWVFDPLGRLLLTWDAGGLVPPGKHSFLLPGSHLATGMYWVQLNFENGFLLEKVVKQ